MMFQASPIAAHRNTSVSTRWWYRSSITSVRTRPTATMAAMASQPRARDATLHGPRPAPEQSLGPEVEHEQEHDEDAGVLQLERQDEQRERLHEPDDEAADAGAGDAAEAAEDDGHEHQHDEVAGDARLDRVVGGQQPAGGGHQRDAGAEGEPVHRAHVDALVAGRLGIVGGGTQGLAEVGAREEQVHGSR